MDIIEKLNRDGMNDRSSDYLYEYFSSKRPHEKSDYINQFNVMVRQKREIRNAQYSSPKRIRFTRLKQREDKRKKDNGNSITIAPFNTGMNGTYTRNAT